MPPSHCGAPASPGRPGQPPCRCGKPTARTPQESVPRRRRPVRRDRLPNQLDLPGPLRLPGPRRLALARRPTARLASVGYCGRVDPSVLHARCAAPHGATGDHGATELYTTRALLAVLITLTEQIKTFTEISEQLGLHADAHIFTSLPRSGRVRAARLLAEIGDCRAPSPPPKPAVLPASLPPPANLEIGAVGFRWACDKQLRDAVTDFAGDSRRSQPLGCRPLQPCPRPRPRPPARGPHPGPSMAPHHLALLAEQHRLRPGQTRRPPTLPP